MNTDADAACYLVATACELVERHSRLDVADGHAVAEVALVRAEVCALALDCTGEVADDLDGAVAELDALLARLERLPEPVPALTG